MNKPRLVILSDLFGTSNETWMDAYRTELKPHFRISEYDSRDLADIAHLEQNEIHTAFVNGGIETAVKNLQIIETREMHLLGFSVGGTIAWKFALESTSVISMTTISSTRLRNETMIPMCFHSIIFGELEEFGPQQEWFTKMKIEPIVIPNSGHECYKDLTVIPQICRQIISGLDLAYIFN